MTRDLAGKALNRPRHLVYLATTARSEEMHLERDSAKPEDDDAYRERSEFWRGGLLRTMLVHTGELGLRIAWKVWRNDKYPYWSPIPGQLCRYIVITVGDQHGRLSECWSNR